MKNVLIPLFIHGVILGGLFYFDNPQYKVPSSVTHFRLPSNDSVTCSDNLDFFFDRPTSMNTKINEAKELAVKFGVNLSETSTLDSYEKVISKVFNKISAGEGDGLHKGELMAQFSKQMRELIAAEALEKTQKKDLEYLLGKSVLKLEEFAENQFEIRPEAEVAIGKNIRLLHINYKQYNEYVRGFEKNQAPFIGLDMSGGTIISRKDIREMEALNYFPVYINHDMKHVKYALYHERYFPILFSSARGQNNIRYVMIGALAEGADTVQFAEERAICTYLKQKGFDLEDAMNYLASAPKDELESIMTEIGHKQTFENLVTGFYKDWKPKATEKFSTKGFSGVGLTKELEDSIKYLRSLQSDPEFVERYNARSSQINHY